MIEVKAPNEIPMGASGVQIFLAGSIEMGAAENWQDRFKKDLADEEVILLNPRRDDWGASWVQSKNNQEFSRQVNWELDNLQSADIVVFYFDPTTKSPITLMEFGYIIGKSIALINDIIVCCPDNFWRKGNVDIMCDRNDITLVTTYEELISKVKSIL